MSWVQPWSKRRIGDDDPIRTSILFTQTQEERSAGTLTVVMFTMMHFLLSQWHTWCQVSQSARFFISIHTLFCLCAIFVTCEQPFLPKLWSLSHHSKILSSITIWCLTGSTTGDSDCRSVSIDQPPRTRRCFAPPDVVPHLRRPICLWGRCNI